MNWICYFFRVLDINSIDSKEEFYQLEHFIIIIIISILAFLFQSIDGENEEKNWRHYIRALHIWLWRSWTGWLFQRPRTHHDIDRL